MKDIYLNIASVPTRLTLAIVCWRCGGTGRPLDATWANDEGLCEGCDGTGMEITSNGKSILALIERAPL